MRLCRNGSSLRFCLSKCQRACEDLDQKQHVLGAAMPWFWPDRTVAKPEDEEEAEPNPEEEDDEDDDVEYEVIITILFVLSIIIINLCPL